MRVIDGQQALLRIFVGESDRHDGRPLYQALVGDCLITTEKVNVVRYGKKSAEW